MTRPLLLLLAAASLSPGSGPREGERTAPGRHERVSRGGLGYALRVPEGDPPEGGFALLIGLHGTGMRGEQMLPWLERHGAARGYLICCPSSTGQVWDHDDTEKVAALVRDLQGEFPVHRRAVFVIGFSNGATWNYHLAFNHPSLFRGVVSLMGGLLSAMGAPVEPNRGIPVYIVNGGKDEIVPLRTARRSVNRLRAAGFDVVYREHPEMGHVVPWDELPLIFAWMQRKAGRLERPGADTSLLWRPLRDRTLDEVRAQRRPAVVYFYRSKKPADPVPLHLETSVFPDPQVREAGRGLLCLKGDLDEDRFWAEALEMAHPGLALLAPGGSVTKRIAGAPSAGRVAELLRAAAAAAPAEPPR